MSAPEEKTFASAGHDVLFGADLSASACDVCGEAVAKDGPVEDEPAFAPPGRGLYVWARSGEIRYEEPPLCSACAAALGLSALARWEIEEEEG